MSTETGADPVTRLKVVLEQKSGEANPTVTVTVTNTNPGPVTILSYNSPLDNLALPLGLLSITPAGAGSPLEIPQIKLRRLWPPTTEQLITIGAGETAKNDIELRPVVVTPSELGERPTVQLKGQWQAVWANTKDQMRESLAEPSFPMDAFKGEFVTDEVQLYLS